MTKATTAAVRCWIVVGVLIELPPGHSLSRILNCIKAFYREFYIIQASISGLHYQCFTIIWRDKGHATALKNGAIFKRDFVSELNLRPIPPFRLLQRSRPFEMHRFVATRDKKLHLVGIVRRIGSVRRCAIRLDRF